ncbi:MAG: biotin--[acetyl-CoA-carboxylase] ligase [Oscillospiraceae bacterium]|jgi:BirA family biotin operon repressor/biotin-[acetyl-CoA-carboxylase] ligase|nr:biotin--[acetyl-CoA-carboxylase] ligase [Oscillospiraceae bacterium]
MNNTPLNITALQSYLGDAPITPHVYDNIASTNAEAFRLAELGAVEGTLLVAAAQTAGRGTRGRAYFSPFGGVYFSLILRPERFDAAFVAAVTPACAVAAAQSVDAVFGTRCGIKWVNDIILRDKKVAGILCEARNGVVVCGIGLNVTAPTNGYPELPNAGAVTDAPPEFARERFAAECATRIFGYYQTLENKAFLGEYRERSVLIGRKVTLRVGECEERVSVTAIDDDFRLIAENGAGSIVKFSFGEVRVSYETA